MSADAFWISIGNSLVEWKFFILVSCKGSCAKHFFKAENFWIRFHLSKYLLICAADIINIYDKFWPSQFGKNVSLESFESCWHVLYFLFADFRIGVHRQNPEDQFLVGDAWILYFSFETFPVFSSGKWAEETIGLGYFDFLEFIFQDFVGRYTSFSWELLVLIEFSVGRSVWADNSAF